MTRIWPVPHEGLGNSSYLAEVAEGRAPWPASRAACAAGAGLRRRPHPPVVACAGTGVYRFWRDLGYAAGGRP